MLLDDMIIKFGTSPWNPRGKYRLYKILAATIGTVGGTTPQGIRLRFPADDITGYYFFRQDYENQLLELIQALPRGGVFIDVGANVGNYSLIASRHLGTDGLVVAFEPVAETYARLTSHIALNRADNIIPFHAAVAANVSTAEMVVSDNSGLSHLGRIERAGHETTQRVATVSLDGLWPGLIGGREIDLLKIDVEGAELGVLHGATRLLREKRIRKIHVEIAPENLARFGTTREQLWSFLEGHGYKPRFKKSDCAIYDEIFDRA